ncbi:MAG: endonuclease/exonuclease/phosphatase family protein [Maritimibacter sp.]|nr:endonuclease/exonuclease/phosphatase family protein [Maritimibacter sp.]
MPFYHDLKHYSDDPALGGYPGKSDWIARRLLTLRRDLHQAITSGRRPNSLIVGSWNIRAFDGGIPRLDESMHYIAEIVSRFDICAIQEVRADLTPVRRLNELLGPNWDYFVNDTSDHEGGNHERMAFFYDRNKVMFRNLIGEIVVEKTALTTGNQIARSPFFAAFQAGWFRFTLCSAHIIFGPTDAGGLAQRAEEIGVIAKALTSRAKVEDQVYVLLGDMNIESRDGVVMQALKGSGLSVPEMPATNLGGDKFYDQIAFTTKGKAERKTRLIRSGAFDWRDAVYGPARGLFDGGERVSDADNLAHYRPVCDALRQRHRLAPYKDFARSYKDWTSFEMSDHLPVWVELETDYSDDYLRRFVTAA